MKGRSLITVLLAVAVLGAACAPPGAVSQPQGPIKIGVLAPLTGPLAAPGKDMVDGFNLWFEINGKEVAGRPIEIIVEDTEGSPDVGLDKARRLVEQEQVSMLFGPLLANVGLAVADYLKGTNVPLFYPILSGDDISQRKKVETIIKVAGGTASQPNHPFGQWAAEQGYRKVVTICADYAFGHGNCGGFANTFTDNGGEVVLQLWHPIGTPDFSSYLAQIQALEGEIDLVYALPVGADSIRFIKQYEEFGLKDTIPLFTGPVTVDQSVLRSMGDEAVGVISAGHYLEGRDAPATQEFVRQYEEAYGVIPSYYSASMFTAADWVMRAVEQVNGNVEDTEAFLAAVRSISLEDSPFGPMVLDEYDNPILNIYIRRVERRDDGKLWNVEVDRFENVSQFWTYDKDAFLAQPTYTRDYQGIDWP